MKYCSKCGSEIHPDAVVCVRCGASVKPNASPGRLVSQPSHVKYCSKCGKELNADAVVCVHCGCSAKAPVSRERLISQLKTNRGLLKFILLNAITFGIYGIVVLSSISTDINTIASRHDGKKTMHYCLIAFIFTWLTFGVAPIVWWHRISNRIGNELNRRGLDYNFSALSFWGWSILGCFILVGPFIYHHKLFKAMNLLSEHYNLEAML